MSNDAIWSISTAGIGILIGLFTLPWSNKPGVADEHPVVWFFAWGLLWPYFLLLLSWEWLKKSTRLYAEEWDLFFYRRKALKEWSNSRNEDDDLRDAMRKMNRTRDMYIKRRQ